LNGLLVTYTTLILFFLAMVSSEYR
jgi:hypothetical protein